MTIALRASTRRSRRSPTTTAIAPPISASHVAQAGPPCSSGPKSPGYSICSTMPAASAAGSTSAPIMPVSTAVPPASANAMGVNPARRRAWETETASAKCGKTHGNNSIVSTASVPPSTYAAQRCRAANAASGTRASAGDGNRAAARDDLRTQRVMVQRVDVQLRAVLGQRTPELHRRRRMRCSLANERQEPGKRCTRRQEQRGQRDRRAAQVAAGQQEARDDEAEQGNAEEDGGARVHEQHLHADGCERKAERPAGMTQKEEEERERDGHEHVAVDRPGLAEQRERASVSGCERNCGNGCGEDRSAEPHRAKEREPGLVDDGEGNRGDRARLVQHHLRRTDAAHLRDEGEEGVPERERVPRVQPAVRELVDRADVKVAECVELLHAAEVEEGVSRDRTGHVPERDAEREPDERHDERVPGRRSRHDAQCERERDERNCGEHDERQEDRAVHDQDEEERGAERTEPPRNRGRGAAQSQGAGDERTRQEHHEGSGHEAQPEPEAVMREAAARCRAAAGPAAGSARR